MLLAIYGADNEFSGDNVEMWKDEDNSEDDMQEVDNEEKYPLCPDVYVTVEKRLILLDCVNIHFQGFSNFIPNSP